MKKELELTDVWALYQRAILSSSKRRSQITEQGRWKNYIAPTLGKRLVMSLTNLDLLMLWRDLEQQNLSPQTVYHCLSLLRRVLIKSSEWMKYDKSLPSFKGVMPKFDNRRLRFLDRKEINILIDILSDEITKNWYDITLFAVSTGLRRSEIFNLKLNDINFSGRIATVMDTKSNKNRSVPLNNIAFKIALKKIRSPPWG
ncbi:tyrosine-type recombinase/integrase [Desulfobulbus sp.]|jgi:integrase|uniref:tyrosine-type recombinase/integrase n=1 Tax=Desulfobulbus sp. TaxID=895 RepID=UPI002852BDEE|nr:tyrosine-type recombinase/integrase [Desulfobulbus sp.]